MLNPIYSISVVIPTRNRADSLERCLNSITRQCLDSETFEVIVIDNGSSDSTREVVESFQNRLNLNYQYIEQPGLHVGRHVGMKLANSDIISFVDDDIEAFPNWLTSIVENFQNGEVKMVGGNNIPKFESPPPNWLNQWWNTSKNGRKMIPYLSILDFGKGRFTIAPHYIWGCNFSIRTSVLKLTKGFHPDALPESMIKFRGDGETYVSEFVDKGKMTAMFDSRASVYHCVSNERLTKPYFQKRSFANGVSDSYTLLRKKKQTRCPEELAISL